ncbi:MAG: radical SAM protein, partial [Burkholderiales bacterium RIFOXYC2_FULL_59_8]
MSEIFPIRYVNPVFRPPSEAESLILPVTNGCSWNKCTYCEMYTAPQKKFGVRDEQETLDTIRHCGEQFAGQVQRVFIGDGDAMVLSTRRLMTLLAAIKTHLPKVRRISSYCLPRNLRHKTVQELQELRAAGLSLVYVGAESGDDAVLQHVSKGETFESTRDALDKLGAAGISRSVMLLNGLGGRQLSPQHATNSARLVNLTQPEFLATLVVSFPQGEDRFRQGFPQWEALNQQELFAEMAQFLQALELKRTVFRSD